MKLPNGTPPPQPPTTGSTRQPLPAPAPSETSAALSARIQLDQLQVANRAQVLAKVAEVLNRQGSNAQQLLLDVRGKSLLVDAAIGNTKLEAGDLVKMVRVGNELQLLGKFAPPAESRIAQALAQRLPWQQRLDTGLAQLLGSLAATSRSGVTVPQLPPLPQAAQDAIAQLVARIPTQGALSITASQSGATDPAGQIKQWLAESGLFAEARLTRSADPSLPDLKLALGRVVTALLQHQGGDSRQFNQLKPLTSPELVQAPLQFPTNLAPPTSPSRTEPMPVGQMLRMLAGMLNRISVNQLHSQVLTTRATAEGAAPPITWLMELPWLTPQSEPRLAQLRIEHDRDDSASEQSGARRKVAEWRFSLAMELDQLGPLYFEVSLRPGATTDQSQISARVWAERKQTLEQVEAELHTLRQGLNDLGLEVLDLECRKGQPSSAKTQLEHRLVDIKA